MTIFLYGPPGSGKTMIGRLLAESLRLPFYDLDAVIEARSGSSTPQIFASEGEPGFRLRERTELQRLLALDESVVALGGGALTDLDTRSLVDGRGPILLLTAPLEILLNRLNSDENPRPLLAGDTRAQLVDLLARRAEHYATFPLQLDTAILTPEQAAWEAQVRLGVFHVHSMAASATDAGPSGYDVRVQTSGLDHIGEMLHRRGLKGPVVLVSDTNVGPIYAEQVIRSLQTAGYAAQTVLIPPGEAHKTLATMASLWEAFISAGLERGSTVAALGGGVVGDLAGFAAATFLRGVRWVVLPTSLLAMADASLGGKTGADLPQGKNLIGAFHPPGLVLADPSALATLPEPELRSGLAEVVKHGVIGDPALFARCAQGWGALQSDWGEVVRRAMAVKIKVIQADPFEHGVRAALNLGHTIGHAVELASGFRLRHGEAVAIGMVAEARLAEHISLAQAGLAVEIATVLRGVGLPTEIPPGLDRQAVLTAMGVDKKRTNGKLRFALPVRVGEVKVGVEVGDLTLPKIQGLS